MRPGISTARWSTAETGKTPGWRRQGTFATKRGSLDVSDVTQLQAGHGPAHIAGAIAMNSIIYLVGLVVVVLAILSFLGLR